MPSYRAQFGYHDGMETALRYRVKLFASLKEQTGLAHWECPSGAQLRGSELLHLFFTAFPTLDDLRKTTRLAVNQAFCTDDPLLAEGDEIALIPPVSGG